MSDLALAYNSMMQLQSQRHDGADNMDYEWQSGFMPSLPDDVFLKCLLKVPVQWHANLQRVSRSLRNLVQSREYYEQRKKEGTSTPFVCMLQPLPDTRPETGLATETSSSTIAASCDGPVYGVSVLDVHQQLWERLPPVPGLPGGLPTFCRLVALDGKLVVLGGWCQSSWEPSKSVFVYDLSSQTWRKGADMPSVRSLFACGTIGKKVYVAGGHDIGKEALLSADVYDVDTDCWSSLPNMREERDECAGVTLDAKFYVVSGYKSAAQGAFAKSAEVYDPESNIWSSIDNMWPLESADSSEVQNPGALAAISGHLYTLHGQEIVAYSPKQNAWSVVDKIPDGEKGEMTPASIAATSKALILTGLTKKNEAGNSSRVLSFTPAQGSCKAQWQALTSNRHFLNPVQASCALEL